MKRLVAAVLATVLVFGAASAASAHEEINPKLFPTGQPTFFVLSAANEQKADLVKITLMAPSGVPAGATTKEPPGWAVTKTATAVAWTAGPGAGVKPDHFDQWGFETDGADQPGGYTFKATLGFADGTTTDIQIPVTVVAATNASSSTTVPGTSPATATVQKADSAHATSRANTALIVAVIGGALALAAVAMAAARRRPSTPAEPATTKAQDW